MQLERKDTPVLVWILGILSAVSIASLFPNFLSTALEKFSFSFPALLILLLTVVWVAASDDLVVDGISGSRFLGRPFLDWF